MTATTGQVRSAITQIAADWYAAHRAGPLPEAERAAFLAWLKASPMHIEEYLGVAALERALGAATDEPALSVESWVRMAHGDPADKIVDIAAPSVRFGPMPTHAGRRYRPYRHVAAAACAGVAGLVIVWLIRDGHGLGKELQPREAKAYRTTHGEQRVWPLQDGSTLHVNTDTAVTVRFSPTERLVEVDHGQVAVAVAHDDGRPFRIHAGMTDTVASGTEFDVYRQPDATTLITVISGQVTVSVGQPAPPPGARAGLPGGLRVGAGRRVRVVAGKLPAVSEITDLRETTAWLERKIVFDERPLGAVADEFNRYNDVPFTIDDPALRNLRISGTFNAADTDSFAAFLESLDGVRVERLPTRFKVLNSSDKSGSPGRNT